MPFPVPGGDHAFQWLVGGNNDVPLADQISEAGPRSTLAWRVDSGFGGDYPMNMTVTLPPAEQKSFIPKYYEGMDLEAMLRSLRRCYLTEVGWLRSAETKEAMDRHGRPIPWITYAALATLEKITRSEHRVFEFGSGASSLWWRDRVGTVVSVEHDERWGQHIQGMIGTDNQVCIAAPDEAYHHPQVQTLLQDFQRSTDGIEDPPDDHRFGAYLSHLLRFPKGFFDIIVVDGKARDTAGALAGAQLSEDGIIIIDNADRDYPFAYRSLLEMGFARFDYWGMGPINPYQWCTAFFTRSLKHFSAY